MTKLTYINKKGNPIELAITNHAVKKLRQRYKNLYGSDLDDPNTFIIKKFSSAIRVINHSKKEKTRLKRHGKDTTYFRSSNFTFVVQDATIVTIEISAKGKRHLNKCDAGTADFHQGNKVENKPDISSKLSLNERPSTFFITVLFNDIYGNPKIMGDILKISALPYNMNIEKLISDKTFGRDIQNSLKKKEVTPDSVYGISIRLGKKGERLFLDWSNGELI